MYGLCRTAARRFPRGNRQGVSAVEVQVSPARRFEELVAGGDHAAASRLLLEMHPVDAVDLLLKVTNGDQQRILCNLSDESLAAFLEEMPEEAAARLARRLPVQRLVGVLSEMFSDEATDLLQTLPEEEIEAILDAMGDEAVDLRQLLEYAKESSGGLMTTEFVAVRAQATAQQALDYLRKKAPDAETAYYLYVVDDHRRLVGILSLRDLVISPPERRVEEMMNTGVIRVRVDDDQEHVARLFERYGFLTLPVVDEEERLVGIITIDDAIQVLQDEATEDMYRMVGLVDGESVFSPFFESVRKRLPWLFINLVTAFLSASIVSLFEETIDQLVILATFLPIVAGMGGNAGTQTLTIIVRSIALGEVDFANAKEALKKQILLGLVNGAAVGLVVGIAGYVWKGSAVLGVVLTVALILNMAVGGLVGVAVPMGLKAFRVDPALASGIFVTAFTDILGFLFFLGLATVALARF